MPARLRPRSVERTSLASLDLHTYYDLKFALSHSEHVDELTWVENLRPCSNPHDFAREHAFVVCNSGMRSKTGCDIFLKVINALYTGVPVYAVFKHPGKARAIEYVFANKERLFQAYLDAPDKITFLESLPYIGEITKWHMGRNLGLNCAKPDRHLKRVAAKYNTTYDVLCNDLAEKTGDRVGVVDLVIWRGAVMGLI